MSSFAGFKRRKTNFDDLQKKFETKDSNNRDDDNFYYPARDQAGNGYAVIRFLPTGLDTDPFVHFYSHRFKGLNGWFWNNCRTTLGEDCPVCQANRALVEEHGGDWNAVPKHVQTLVRSRKRQLAHVANVLVVKDPENPENEGTVQLFKFGVKILDKIKQAINPQFPDDPQFDPFNPWTGANFVLKIRKVDGQTNYDSSSWQDVSPIYDNDADIEALAAKVDPLTKFTDEEFFAPYDVQEKRLQNVLGLADQASRTVSKEPVAEPTSNAPSDPDPETPSSSATDDLTSSEELSAIFADDEDDVPF